MRRRSEGPVAVAFSGRLACNEGRSHRGGALAEKRRTNASRLETEIEAFETEWGKMVTEIRGELDALAHPPSVKVNDDSTAPIQTLFQHLDMSPWRNPQLATLAHVSEGNSPLDADGVLLTRICDPARTKTLPPDSVLAERLEALQGQISGLSSGCYAHLQRAKLKMKLARAVCANTVGSGRATPVSGGSSPLLSPRSSPCEGGSGNIRTGNKSPSPRVVSNARHLAPAQRVARSSSNSSAGKASASVKTNKNSSAGKMRRTPSIDKRGSGS